MGEARVRDQICVTADLIGIARASDGEAFRPVLVLVVDDLVAALVGGAGRVSPQGALR
jgi:hypothetical protein